MSPVTERLQRLVMHAFRGVPTEMTIDFGKGESTVVYGENGTGKSTIADALEWYFKGEIELLSHEGRQHAVRHVGGDDDGVTSVEVLTSGMLGGKVVFPDERTPETFEALRRETFLLRGRTLADFINKTKTEKWKALVEILGLDAIESLREDLQRVRNDLRKALKTAEEEVRVYRRALSSGADTVSEETVLESLRQICELLGVDAPQSLDQVAEPSWITAAAGASANVSASSARENLLAEIGALKAPDFNKSVFEAWNKLTLSDRARLLPRASLVREAKRLFDAQSIEAGRCPLCGQKVDQKVLARRIESALVEMMEASRDLERFRDPILQQADGLESAHDLRETIYDRARGLDLEIPSVPPAAGHEDTRPGRCARTGRRRHDHDVSLRRASVGQDRRQVGEPDLYGGTQRTRQPADDAGGAVSADPCLATRREKERSCRAGAGHRRDGVRRVSAEAKG